MIVFGRLARRGTAKDSPSLSLAVSMSVEMIAARHPPAPESAKTTLAAERDWPTGALGGIVAHFEAGHRRQCASTGRQGFLSPQFFRRGFRLAPQIRTKPDGRMGGRTTPRRSLIHACRTVNQNRRQPALDLRDAHAADVTSLSVYGGWVRRSRRAVLRW
jgi:hypothetical protein